MGLNEVADNFLEYFLQAFAIYVKLLPFGS